MKYLFDANIFIRSKNEMPIDLWPTFWERIAGLIHGGHIFSSIKIRDEINRGNDDLTRWMRQNVSSGFYLSVDSDVIVKYAETQNWAMASPIYKPSAKNEYAQVADAYLVATAAAKNMTVVTYEVSDSTCKKRIKIPDACIALGVRYCDLNTVLRNLGVRI